MFTSNKSHYALLLGLAIATLVSACGGSQATTENATESMPGWCQEIPEDPNYLFSCATATSRSMQLAIDQAQTSARGDIASTLETKFEGLTRQFNEEVGVGEDSELLSQFTQAYQTVISQVLVGSSTRERKVVPENSIYRAYVLMEMPIGEASQELMAKIESNQNMYTRFRSSQAFEELEEEVEEYEQWKEEQRQSQNVQNQQR